MLLSDGYARPIQISFIDKPNAQRRAGWDQGVQVPADE